MIPRPGPTEQEPAWSRYLADRWGGVSEYRTADGSRVDILTGSTAWECDWAKKWQEAIGQAIWYGVVTDRRPGVVLLTRGKPTERLYIARAAGACGACGVRFRVVGTRFV